MSGKQRWLFYPTEYAEIPKYLGGQAGQKLLLLTWKCWAFLHSARKAAREGEPLPWGNGAMEVIGTAPGVGAAPRAREEAPRGGWGEGQLPPPAGPPRAPHNLLGQSPGEGCSRLFSSRITARSKLLGVVTLLTSPRSAGATPERTACGCPHPLLHPDPSHSLGQPVILLQLGINPISSARHTTALSCCCCCSGFYC